MRRIFIRTEVAEYNFWQIYKKKLFHKNTGSFRNFWLDESVSILINQKDVKI